MKIIKLNAIDSTNRFLKELAQEATAENYTIVVANQQTDGKGQRGASWISESDKGLTFSLLYHNLQESTSNLFALNCIVALSIVEALQSISFIRFQIKWPNDILAENKKIGGVLIENSFKNQHEIVSIIGIGINVNQLHFENLPQASSLALLECKTFDKEEIMLLIAKQLQFNLENAQKIGVDFYWERYHELLYKRGIVSTFEDVLGNKFVGKIIAVTQEGKLQLELENNLISFFDLKEIKMLF
ncbi:biotin--[acetyl-CoA-carboxylase] ligase [Flavobacterium sp.]|jgi:BirA family biotin operon repressor/biotin-[acetyl-CoA-carboxylase] ligase|uniref:biotin--[acetyl-CoA-carboxylase] ligase n=1 Tax=Flavobacterium sp. TaxID=239 RepID=UPI0037BE9181